jgi:hypothetical protein
VEFLEFVREHFLPDKEKLPLSLSMDAAERSDV